MLPAQHRRKVLAIRRARIFADAEDAWKWAIYIMWASIVVGVIVLLSKGKDIHQDPIVQAFNYYHFGLPFLHRPTTFIMSYVETLIHSCLVWSAFLFYARVRANAASLVKRSELIVKCSAIVFAFFMPMQLLPIMMPPADAQDVAALGVFTVANCTFCLAVSQWVLVQVFVAAQWNPCGYNFVAWASVSFVHVVASLVMSFLLYRRYSELDVEALGDPLTSTLSITHFIWFLSLVAFRRLHVLKGFAPGSDARAPPSQYVLEEETEAASRETTRESDMQEDVEMLRKRGGDDERKRTRVTPGDGMVYARAGSQNLAVSARTTTRITLPPQSDFLPFVEAPHEDAERVHQLARAAAEAYARSGGCPVGDRGVLLGTLRATLHIDNGIAMLHPKLRVGLLKKEDEYEARVRFSIAEAGVARLAMRVAVPPSMALLRDSPACPVCRANGYQPLGLIAPEPSDDAWHDGHFADFLFQEELKEFYGVNVETSAAALQLQRRTGSIWRRLWLLLRRLDGLVKRALYWRQYLRRVYFAGRAPDTGLLGKDYFAGLPFGLGPGYCKWGLLHHQDHFLSVPGRTLQEVEEQGFSNEQKAAALAEDAKLRYVDHANELLFESPAMFHFCVQVATDAEHCANDAGCIWSEDLSPYMPVGYLEIDEDQELEPDGAEDLGFNVWNQLVEHRPIGVTNCARGLIYQQSRAKAAASTSDVECRAPTAGTTVRDLALTPLPT